MSRLTIAEATRIVYAGLSRPDAIAILDDVPEGVASRVVANGYTAAALAAELGLAWPMRPELLAVAEWAGRARWATGQRDEAVHRAHALGCPTRVLGQAAGMSHAGIGRILARH